MGVENFENSAEKKEELELGDKVVYEKDGRTGIVDRVFPNMPEGTISIKFDDGKKEGVLVKDIEKITEETLKKEKETSHEKEKTKDAV